MCSVFAPAYGFGGMPKSVFDLCRGLGQKAGISVSAYTSNADVVGLLNVPVEEPCSVGGVDVTYFPVRYRPGFIARALYASLSRVISNFDLLHLHGCYEYFTAVAAHCARKAKIPYIISPRGMLDPSAMRVTGWWKKRLYLALVGRRDLNKAAGIHFTAEEERRLLEPFRFRTPGFVVPNGIDIAEYAKPTGSNPLVDRYPHLTGKRVLLYLGRLHPKKGLELLVDAFARLSTEQENVHLLVAGSDETPYARSLKKLVADRGVGQQVDFVGLLTGEAKLWALYLSEMSILPSYSENFGIALIESFCCGKPVVTTNQVNLAPDISEYQAGLISDCDVEGIRSAISYLLDHPDEAVAMGHRGRRLVNDRFTLDRTVDQMIAAYRMVLEDQSMRETHR